MLADAAQGEDLWDAAAGLELPTEGRRRQEDEYSPHQYYNTGSRGGAPLTQRGATAEGDTLFASASSVVSDGATGSGMLPIASQDLPEYAAMLQRVVDDASVGSLLSFRAKLAWDHWLDPYTYGARCWLAEQSRRWLQGGLAALIHPVQDQCTRDWRRLLDDWASDSGRRVRDEDKQLLTEAAIQCRELLGISFSESLARLEARLADAVFTTLYNQQQRAYFSASSADGGDNALPTAAREIIHSNLADEIHMARMSLESAARTRALRELDHRLQGLSASVAAAYGCDMRVTAVNTQAFRDAAHRHTERLVDDGDLLHGALRELRRSCDEAARQCRAILEPLIGPHPSATTQTKGTPQSPDTTSTPTAAGGGRGGEGSSAPHPTLLNQARARQQASMAELLAHWRQVLLEAWDARQAAADRVRAQCGVGQGDALEEAEAMRRQALSEQLFEQAYGETIGADWLGHITDAEARDLLRDVREPPAGEALHPLWAFLRDRLGRGRMRVGGGGRVADAGTITDDAGAYGASIAAMVSPPESVKSGTGPRTLKAPARVPVPSTPDVEVLRTPIAVRQRARSLAQVRELPGSTDHEHPVQSQPTQRSRAPDPIPAPIQTHPGGGDEGSSNTATSHFNDAASSARKAAMAAVAARLPQPRGSAPVEDTAIPSVLRSSVLPDSSGDGPTPLVMAPRRPPVVLSHGDYGYSLAELAALQELRQLTKSKRDRDQVALTPRRTAAQAAQQSQQQLQQYQQQQHFLKRSTREPVVEGFMSPPLPVRHSRDHHVGPLSSSFTPSITYDTHNGNNNNDANTRTIHVAADMLGHVGGGSGERREVLREWMLTGDDLNADSPHQMKKKSQAARGKDFYTPRRNPPQPQPQTQQPHAVTTRLRKSGPATTATAQKKKASTTAVSDVEALFTFGANKSLRHAR